MKKIIIGLLLGICLCCSGCTNTDEGSKDYDIHADLIKIEEQVSLYYRSDTKIIYILFNEYATEVGYGYMAPYYSEHGKLCRYVDGKIIEVE